MTENFDVKEIRKKAVQSLHQDGPEKMNSQRS